MKKKRIFIIILVIIAANVAYSFISRKIKESNQEKQGSAVEVDIPYVINFTCDYYDKNGKVIADRSIVFNPEDEIKVKVGFTLLAEAFNAGKSEFTIKFDVPSGFEGKIIDANTSATNDTDLTAKFTVDDKNAKSCSVQLKLGFNYCGGDLKFAYSYDGYAYETGGTLPLNCNKRLKFEKGTDGYSVSMDSDYSEWLGKTDNLRLPSSFMGKPLKAIRYDAFKDCTSLKSVIIPDGVRSIGSNAFSGCGNLTNIEIPDSVQSIESNAFSGCGKLTTIKLPKGITTIGSGAFENCNNLTSITITDGVTNIGAGAFKDCNKLTSMTIPKSVKNIGKNAFSGCGGLTAVIIEKGVKSIDASAFEGCVGLTNITIPDSVTSIGESAFSGCGKLASVTIGNGVTNIGNEAFNGCGGLTTVTIPDSVRVIGASVFKDCGGLKSVIVGSGLTSMGNGVFDGCDNLADISVDDGNDTYKSSNGNLYTQDGTLLLYPVGKTDTDFYIPDDVIGIADSAFNGCDRLKNITIGNGVTKINYGTFKDCCNLTTVKIGDGLTIIEDVAFSGFKKLTSITVSEGNGAFKSINGNLYTKDEKTFVQYAIGKSDKQFTIPDGVTRIGWCAFYSCNSLTSVSIPDGVIRICGEAFGECNGLTNIVIPGSVTTIDSMAFVGCRGLTNFSVSNDNAVYKAIGGNLYSKDGTKLIQYAVGKSDSEFTLPGGVTSIGSYAFGYCSSLTAVTLPDSVTTIENVAFRGCENLTSVIMGRGVKKVERGAFSDCNKLATVKFYGTKSEWFTAAQYAGSVFNDSQTTVKCSDGDLKFKFS